MKIEAIKSILLTVLIGLSLLLTLAIWNYHPTYEQQDESESGVIEAKISGVSKSTKDIIQPSQIVYHEGDVIRGLIEKEKEKELFDEMLTWSLYDFSLRQQNNLDEGNFVELVFPTEMSTATARDLFKTDDSEITYSSFNRIKIDLNEDRTENQMIFYLNNEFVMSANIQNITQVINSLKLFRQNNDFVAYTPFVNTNEISIYLPNEIEMERNAFRFNTIALSSLQNVLFNNTSAVFSAPRSYGAQIYTDGIREMVVNGYHIEFTDPTNSEGPDNQKREGRQFVSQTLKFVNDHTGWTTEGGFEYHLFNLNLPTNTVDYQLNYAGFPVFSTNQLATISVTMTNQSLEKYSRPLIQLKNTFGDGTKVDGSFPTGREVAEILNSEQYQSIAILDVLLGYELHEDQGGQVFELKPKWYVKSYGGWNELVTSSQTSGGGDSSAMGPN